MKRNERKNVMKMKNESEKCCTCAFVASITALTARAISRVAKGLMSVTSLDRRYR